MKNFLITIGVILLILVITVPIFIGSYNKMVQLEESVKEKWSQVENVYQRRYDLIPNLVETVKGYAVHEKETFILVTEARAKAGGTFNISDEVLNDPAKFEKFQQAQNSLGGAMQRLLVVMEKYPELKANQNFLALQDQLEGTENRIAVERMRYNETARDYNTYIKKLPQAFIANLSGFREKPYFKSQKEAESAPKVKF